jgi:hypothetical protein
MRLEPGCANNVQEKDAINVWQSRGWDDGASTSTAWDL